MTAAVKVSLLTSTLILMTSVVTSRPLGVVDLTYTLGIHTLFWPGQPPFTMTNLKKGPWAGDPTSWLEMNAFSLGEHGGTHIDSPAHFIKGGRHTDKIPASNLVGPGVVVDVTKKVENNEMYAVTADDFLEWEATNGPIPQRAVVLINFGWGKRYPDPKLVFNTETPNDPDTFRFPGLSADAAAWLTTNRHLTALGVDTPSADPSNTTDYPAHRNLLEINVLILEYVANLNELPARGFDVIIGVIKLSDGSGGPARILALMDRQSSAASNAFVGGEGGSIPCGNFLVVGMMVMLSVSGLL